MMECESEGLSTAQLSRLKHIANITSKINILLQNSLPKVTHLLLFICNIVVYISITRFFVPFLPFYMLSYVSRYGLTQRITDVLFLFRIEM